MIIIIIVIVIVNPNQLQYREGIMAFRLWINPVITHRKLSLWLKNCTFEREI